MRVALREALFIFFFFNDPATPKIYPLSLPAALPILPRLAESLMAALVGFVVGAFFLSLAYADMLYALVALAIALGKIAPAKGSRSQPLPHPVRMRSEEHTSELQSLAYLVCRLLLEKK